MSSKKIRIEADPNQPGCNRVDPQDCTSQTGGVCNIDLLVDAGITNIKFINNTGATITIAFNDPESDCDQCGTLLVSTDSFTLPDPNPPHENKRNVQINLQAPDDACCPIVFTGQCGPPADKPRMIVKRTQSEEKKY